MIANEAELQALTNRLRDAPVIGVDTEADSLHCYQEKLCLIQISAPGIDALVDPLAGLELQPFLDVLGSSTLIFHGLDYDVRLLRRVGFQPPQWAFDTMIAARFLGKTAIGLAALIEDYFGVTLPKGSQKANWALRPLSSHMAEYALNDTRYLLPLREQLESELRELGRWQWFVETCERAMISATRDRPRDKDSAWQIAGSGKLRGRAAALLRALWQWRDEEARRADRPAFHILSNDELITSAQAFASGKPVDIPRLRNGRRARFFHAADAALDLPESEWPEFERIERRRTTDEEIRKFQALKARRDKVAADLKIDPALIASKTALEALARDPEATAATLLPWQQALLSVSPPKPLSIPAAK
jgi:ribonuclease D